MDTGKGEHREQVVLVVVVVVGRSRCGRTGRGM